MAILEVTPPSEWLDRVAAPAEQCTRLSPPWPDFDGQPRSRHSEDSTVSGSYGVTDTDKASRDGTSDQVQSKEAKMKELRERNRVAQSRYREKCRNKRNNVIANHQVMREQLEVARREHAELARSMDVNERLLTMRDAYIAVLEEAKGLGVPRACAYDRPCLARLEPMFTMGQHAVVHCSCFNGGCTGWNVDRELSESEREEFRMLGAPELTRRWKRVLSDCQDAVANLEAAGPKQSSVLQEELMASMKEGCVLSYRITHYLPGTFSKVLGIQAPASEYRGLWSDVLDALRLTPRQARAMTAHVRSFHDRYLGLLRQRGMLLRETAGAPRSEEGMPLQATAAASLAVAQRLWELECSLATEQRLVGEATGHLFGLLDPIQNSTLFTASAPHLPDVLCLFAAWEERLATMPQLEDHSIMDIVEGR